MRLTITLSEREQELVIIEWMTDYIEQNSLDDEISEACKIILNYIKDEL